MPITFLNLLFFYSQKVVILYHHVRDINNKNSYKKKKNEIILFPGNRQKGWIFKFAPKHCREKYNGFEAIADSGLGR